MLPPTPFGAADYVAAIKKSGLTIYAPITPGDPKLWIRCNFGERRGGLFSKHGRSGRTIRTGKAKKSVSKTLHLARLVSLPVEFAQQLDRFVLEVM